MDDLVVICPCCSAYIQFDEAGIPFAEQAFENELEDNEFRGLGRLVSVDATPNWREKEYRFNQQGLDQQHRLEDNILTPQQETAPAPEPFEHDAAIEAELNKDLSKKGIKTLITDDNDND